MHLLPGQLFLNPHRNSLPLKGVPGLRAPSGHWTVESTSPLAPWSPTCSSDSPGKAPETSSAARPGFAWLRQVLECFGDEESEEDIQGGYALAADACSVLLRDTNAASVDATSDARITLVHIDCLLGGVRAAAPLLQPAALRHVLLVRGC